MSAIPEHAVYTAGAITVATLGNIKRVWIVAGPNIFEFDENGSTPTTPQGVKYSYGGSSISVSGIGETVVKATRLRIDGELKGSPIDGIWAVGYE